MIPPIHQHAIRSDFRALQQDIDRGVPINLRNPDNHRTPLMEGLGSRNVSVALVQFLIQQGADVNAIAVEPALAPVFNLETIHMALEKTPAIFSKIPGLNSAEEILENLDSFSPFQEHTFALAIRTGNPDIIKAMLDAGADIHYQTPSGYTPILDAFFGNDVAHSAHLLLILRLLIERGAVVNAVTDFSESALSVASSQSRFDAVSLLLQAGADPSPLSWTPLMRAIAVGSYDDVEMQLQLNPDLAATDHCGRTPFLLSVAVGDLAKSKRLLLAGANPAQTGHGGKSPIVYAIPRHIEMLRWLLTLQVDPNHRDDLGHTPILTAVTANDIETICILIAAGATPRTLPGQQPLISSACDLPTMRLLLKHGADIQDIDADLRATLTKLPNDKNIQASRVQFLAGRSPRFGATNPEKLNLPFWQTMVKSGARACEAREFFADQDTHFPGSVRDASVSGHQQATEESVDAAADDGPVWTFDRFGKSLTELPDGRIIQIAGEHEDYYDPDFFIYNDVVVHYPDGAFDIFIYPRDVFPPTDFHTATLVADYIYIVGCLGYPADRKRGHTPVYRLNIHNFHIDRVPTSGDDPGLIYRHKAKLLAGHALQITEGKCLKMQSGDNAENTEQEFNNTHTYLFHIPTATWNRIS